MKQITLLFTILLLPLSAHSSPLFLEAFSSYVEVKQLEERFAQAEESEKPKLAAALTDAKIAFQGVLRDGENAFSPWEKKITANLNSKKKQIGPEAMEFLQKEFADGKNLSPLEWSVIREWFGPAAQEEFLKSSFHFTLLPETAPAPANERIIWVIDPFRKLLSAGKPGEKDFIKTLDPKIETFDISAYTQPENQAEDLKRHLLAQTESFILVSSGEASAVVHKMLDIYPSFRGKPQFRAWINVDGRLFGKEEKGRKLASSSDPSQVFQNEALKGLRTLRLERHNRPIPFGKGFPIINLVSLDSKHRPADDLREALVMDGVNWYVAQGTALSSVKKAIPALSTFTP